jgi:ABC-type lipoprotein export system ATPase subunit
MHLNQNRQSSGRLLSRDRTTKIDGKSFSAFQNDSILYRLVNACVNFKDVFALKNISLNICDGDFIFVTGPSGAGKTTLLNVLSGDQKITSGAISNSKIKRDNLFISRVFQNLQIVESWTVEQNIEICYSSEIFNSRQDFKNEVRDLLNLFELNKNLKKKLFKLNGGAKQKVAIIRALLTRPNIFIADEPTSSLDKENAKRLYEVLKFYNQKTGMTVVWATHQVDLINQFHGKLIHLKSGNLVRAF